MIVKIMEPENQTESESETDTEAEREETESPVKEKKPRSESQMAVLEKARQKAYEIRKQRAVERQVKEESSKIDRRLTDAEKDKEILKLKQTAMELKLDVEIKKPTKAKQSKPPKPKPTFKEPVEQAESEAVKPTPTVVLTKRTKAFSRDAHGNLLFYE